MRTPCPAVRRIASYAAALLAVGLCSGGGVVHDAPRALAAPLPSPCTAARVSCTAAALSARSVDGRALRAVHVGSRQGPAVLVFGAVHGNESAGIAVARDLLADAALIRTNVWVVADLNPDGVARGTRQNARSVDLNRNFPWRWQRVGQPGEFAYPGPRVLSEPESRFAFDLIMHLRPTVTIWFHQPLGVVDASGGSLRVERRFAARVGLPVRQLQRYRGSATTWQDHRVRGSTAFVVELPRGSLAKAAIERYAHAVELAAR
jgi:protein MpaA